MAPNYRLKMTEMMGSITKASPCIICCGRNKSLQIRHIHLSTSYYNKQKIKEGDMRPLCHFCDIPHQVDHMTRQNVILTTSTLSGIQYLQGWGWNGIPPTHCDMEAIPGAKIHTLKKAWERAYMTNPLAINTVLVAGLNDVKDTAKLYLNKYTMEQVAEFVSEDILNSIKGLHRLIRDHSKKYDVVDTFAVGTILHVPALYWHDDDGPVPSDSYVNYRSIIDRTNLKIEAFNIEVGSSSAPKLHQTGERCLKHGQKRIFMWDVFREEAKSDMMHLKDPQRFKMAKCIVKYFDKATPRAYQHLD